MVHADEQCVPEKLGDQLPVSIGAVFDGSAADRLNPRWLVVWLLLGRGSASAANSAGHSRAWARGKRSSTGASSNSIVKNGVCGPPQFCMQQSETGV
jgi:hypothetical protein